MIQQLLESNATAESNDLDVDKRTFAVDAIGNVSRAGVESSGCFVHFHNTADEGTQKRNMNMRRVFHW